MTKTEIPVIGEKEHFYGYITGVGVESNADPCATSYRLYATFEYNGEATVWQVPDWKLFEILSRHLVDMARMRSDHDDYGYDKLYIMKFNGIWDVFLP